MSKFRSYDDELTNKKLSLSRSNVVTIRNKVANWLHFNRNTSINKFDIHLNTDVHMSFGEAFLHFKDTIEPKLQKQQQATNWYEFINIIRDYDRNRPITFLEEIAIKHMYKANINTTEYTEIVGDISKLNTVVFSQFIYFGSNNDTGTSIVNVKFGNNRDKDFEQQWIEKNKDAKLYCVKNQITAPIDNVNNCDYSSLKVNKLYPNERNFYHFVQTLESDKSLEKIKLYTSIAIKQYDDYNEMDDDIRKSTITYKYIDYMKKFKQIKDDDIAIKELQLLETKKRKREPDNIEPKNKIQYSEEDISSLEINRKLFEKKYTNGYKMLKNTNKGLAPYGYDYNMIDRIAPHGYLNNDINDKVKLRPGRPR